MRSPEIKAALAIPNAYSNSANAKDERNGRKVARGGAAFRKRFGGLRITERQQVYTNAKSMLPEKARGKRQLVEEKALWQRFGPEIIIL
jgi:hypothetical protein